MYRIISAFVILSLKILTACRLYSPEEEGADMLCFLAASCSQLLCFTKSTRFQDQRFLRVNLRQGGTELFLFLGFVRILMNIPLKALDVANMIDEN